MFTRSNYGLLTTCQCGVYAIYATYTKAEDVASPQQIIQSKYNKLKKYLFEVCRKRMDNTRKNNYAMLQMYGDEAIGLSWANLAQSL